MFLCVQYLLTFISERRYEFKWNGSDVNLVRGQRKQLLSLNSSSPASEEVFRKQGRESRVVLQDRDAGCRERNDPDAERRSSSDCLAPLVTELNVFADSFCCLRGDPAAPNWRTNVFNPLRGKDQSPGRGAQNPHCFISCCPENICVCKRREYSLQFYTSLISYLPMKSRKKNAENNRIYLIREAKKCERV